MVACSVGPGIWASGLEKVTRETLAFKETRYEIPFLPKKKRRQVQQRVCAHPGRAQAHLSSPRPGPTVQAHLGPRGSGTCWGQGWGMEWIVHSAVTTWELTEWTGLPPFAAPAGSPRDRPSLSQLWVTGTSVTQPREAGGGGYKTRLSGACGVGPHPPGAVSLPLTRPALGRGHSRLGSSGLPPLEGLRAGLWALPWG